MFIVGKPTGHAAYLAHQNSDGAFQAAAAASGPISDVGTVSASLEGLVESSPIRWEDIQRDEVTDRFTSLIDHVLPLLGSTFRLDVLVWETAKVRSVIGTDGSEVGPLERMLFHLLEGVTSTKWSDSTQWVLLPDAEVEADWQHPRMTRLSKVQEISPREFGSEPMLQVANLFAGLAAFSWEAHDLFLRWSETEAAQIAPELPQMRRCVVLGHLLARCRSQRSGVGISTGGLRTRDWSRPLNFWPWDPRLDPERHSRVSRRRSE